MNNYKKYLEELIPAVDRERVWLFFLAFSRFECALKNSGFADGSADGVDPAWDRFASRHRHAFNPDSGVRLRAACDYFISHPPMKQVLNGSSLGWAGSHKLGTHPLLCWLVTMLRRVRNNLFHGGKFPMPIGPISDPVRDSLLIEHSLVILCACLALDSGVQQKFQEPLA